MRNVNAIVIFLLGVLLLVVDITLGLAVVIRGISLSPYGYALLVLMMPLALLCMNYGQFLLFSQDRYRYK